MIFKAIKAYRKLECRQEEEDKRALVEEIRRKALTEVLWKSYNNNVKLWSLTAFGNNKRSKT